MHKTDAPQAPPAATQLVRIAERELRTDLVLAGDAVAHRDVLRQMLAHRGWSIQWDPSGWSGLATKGNKVMNLLFGAFAQYHEIRFAFATMPDGSTGLTVYRTGDGCMGGLYGMYKVKKSFRATSASIESHYATTGNLLSSSGA